jgi:hypothetical protein
VDSKGVETPGKLDILVDGVELGVALQCLMLSNKLLLQAGGALFQVLWQAGLDTEM